MSAYHCDRPYRDGYARLAQLSGTTSRKSELPSASIAAVIVSSPWIFTYTTQVRLAIRSRAFTLSHFRPQLFQHYDLANNTSCLATNYNRPNYAKYCIASFHHLNAKLHYPRSRKPAETVLQFISLRTHSMIYTHNSIRFKLSKGPY
jgi:hypothetical protein